MANRRPAIERHLVKASAALDERKKLLAERKVKEKDTRKDPIYRGFEAKVRQFKKQLKALDKVVAVNDEAAQRKVERLAAPPKVKVKKVAPVKAAPKVKKPKKDA